MRFVALSLITLFATSVAAADETSSSQARASGEALAALHLRLDAARERMDRQLTTHVEKKLAGQLTADLRDLLELSRTSPAKHAPASEPEGSGEGSSRGAMTCELDEDEVLSCRVVGSPSGRQSR